MAVIKIAEESGHIGTLLSLGGIPALPSRGRELWHEGGTCSTGGTGYQTLPNNPKRIAAMIASDGPGDLSILIGGNTIAILVPNSVFQIDSNYPWIGSVNIACGTTCDFHTTELVVS